MPKSEGYSLWFIPPGRVYAKLAGHISYLSKRYDTREFEPHVTLINRVFDSKENIQKNTSELASVVKPFWIELTTLGYLDEFFKCVFIKVIKSKEIQKANMVARRVLNLHNAEASFMPHLSLMYGDFPQEKKLEIIRDIGIEFYMRFKVRKIYLFSTNGVPDKWDKIDEFSMLF